MVKLPRIRYLLLALAVLAGAILAARAVLLGKAVKTVTVTRQAITETVISSGRVITPERIELGSELVGNVVAVPVEEGTHVTAGQVLVRLDDGEQRASLEQARRSVDEADARLWELKQVSRPVAEQALAQAEANLALAGSEYERARQLTMAGFYNRSRLEEARRALDAARANREAAAAQVRGSRDDGAEGQLARARQAQARAALELARARQANTVIRAPAAGVLVRKYVEAGDIVTQGKKLIELAADGETQLVLQIDEMNLGRLAVGQKASVLADAYPGRDFPAEIFFIAPIVDAQKGSVEVKLRVPRPPAFLKPDMTVSAEIEVGHRAAALTLPSDAVHDAAGAQPWVLVVAAGRATRRPVRLGLRGTGQVEIVDGLAAGEPVILTTAAIGEGQRVRAGH